MQNEKIGFVVIGRNEGERLKRCLESVCHHFSPVAYVDSGSTDGSVSLAAGFGVHVIELNAGTPFSAARARNEGFYFLLEKHPSLEFIQFVDGDCVIDHEWLDKAIQFLTQNSKAAVVCGRTKEMRPEASIYNLLCDMEWAVPAGETNCGGNAMIRVEALKEVSGFNPALIAGEEPELCIRLRKKEWKIFRVNIPMVKHDAAMTRFSQWWKRCTRGGYAYAQVGHMHGEWGAKDMLGIFFWGGLFPLFGVIFVVFDKPMPALGIILCYVFLSVKILLNVKKRGWGIKNSFFYTVFCVIAKIPQFFGVSRYWLSGFKRNKTDDYRI